MTLKKYHGVFGINPCVMKDTVWPIAYAYRLPPIAYSQ
jgi:hypothetical protein